MDKIFMVPKSLKNQCLNYVCDNINDVFTRDTYIPMELSEALLLRLSLKNQINNKTLSYFSSENVNLRTFELPMINCVTEKGLLILKTHKLKRIEVHSLNCGIHTMVELLNTWTINNLEVLNVSNTHVEIPFEMSSNLISSSLTKLKNLRSLNVSKTVFNTNHLVAIVENLLHLEALNISCTNVDNLLPLEKIKNKLKILSVYNLREALTKMVDFAPLRCMTSLTHLDLSLDLCELIPFSYKTLLTDPFWLPDLVALDISGSESVGQKVWEDFLTNHRNIQFLGLMDMNDSSENVFNIPSHPLYKMDLMITGIMNKSQLLLSVKMYPDRPNYIYTCLNCIRRITLNYNFETPDIQFIMVLLDVMKCVRYEMSLYLTLMLGISCLYNLTKNHLASKIHPCILASIVDILLNVVEHYLCVKPIQENTFLVLNNKNLLNNVKMDYVRWAKLVLNALQFSNANSTMISLFSKIAVKMSLSEISRIKLNYRAILILTAVVSEKLTNLTIDTDMKCSINALWSLTDESPPSCELFIKLDGLQIFMILLNTFIDYNSLESKVLRVLINISKIPHLRTKLLDDSIFPTFRRLLRSKNIKVSYCAAEIIAHLACVPRWETSILVDKAEILKELRFAVKEWVPPKKIILKYRSFQSFNDLFHLTDSPQVQLWAAWAILHACTINGENYCAMLNKDIGMNFFKNISSNESFDPEVRELCDRITYLIKYLK